MAVASCAAENLPSPAAARSSRSAAACSRAWSRPSRSRVYGGAARRDPDALLHGSIARFTEQPTLPGYLGQLYAISGWTSMPWLRSLRQHTLVLAGDDDPIVPLINGRILARCIPRAQLQIVRHGGHLFLLESPAEMAGLVAAFLSGDHLPSDPATDP